MSEPKAEMVLVPREPTEAMIEAGSNAPQMKIIEGVTSLHQVRTGVTLTGLGSTPETSALAEIYRAMVAAASPQVPLTAQPIDMVLYCPKCGTQHVDAPDFTLTTADPACVTCGGAGSIPYVSNDPTISGTDPCPACRKRVDWTNPPHKSHLCHGCGHIWRPADVPTNGVAAIKTKGANDSAALLDHLAVRPQEQEAKDAARFRWLDYSRTWDVVNNEIGHNEYNARWSVEFYSDYGVGQDEDDVRKAIDAAIAAQAAQPKDEA